jgi:hypothetical protein
MRLAATVDEQSWTHLFAAVLHCHLAQLHAYDQVLVDMFVC